MKLIDKAALIAEIERRKEINKYRDTNDSLFEDEAILSFINTLEVKDPYEQCVQYDSVKAGIQAHAETYSFNIESELFNQLTKEQQKLWRKEIEQACISGGEMGVELARDTRYKETLEVKEVNSLTPEEIKKICTIYDNLKQERECATVLYNSDETFFNHVLMEYKSIAQKGE